MKSSAQANQNVQESTLNDDTVILAGCFNKVFQGLNARLFAGLSLQCQQETLLAACESLLLDLERTKQFHGMDLSDRHKRAGFTYRWLTRFRPLHCKETKGLSNLGLKANDMFALRCAMKFLKVNVPAGNRELCVEANNILYSSQYRDLKGEEWALVFYFMEKKYPRGSLN